MNPSTAMARTLVEELLSGGVREAVVAPGSRSAPLAIALAEADERGEVRLHVRIDECSASYLALGLARASGQPVPVVCTSGTAAALFHAAVLEASQSGVPLLVLTADRPPELRGTGANQTIDQMHLYRGAVRWFSELGVAEGRDGEPSYWRSVAARALLAAADPRDPGPVHLNLAFREPLVPGDVSAQMPARGASTGDVGRTTRLMAATRPVDVSEVPLLRGRGVVLVGDGAREVDRVLELAGALGWPILSEPSGNARRGPQAIATYPLLLADEVFLAEHRPDVVLTVGRVTLSRPPLAMARWARHHVAVDSARAWSDPTRTADLLMDSVPVAAGVVDRAPERWLRSWRAADGLATGVVEAATAGRHLSEPGVARHLVARLPERAVLFVGSSRPGRDVEAFAAPREGVRVLANRGVAGIDGLVSSALGTALAHQRDGGGPAYALLGDLSLLHDSNGLVLGPDEPRPDLALVVVDNGGGGMFGTLPPYGHPAFERVFATPHGVDLVELCRACGVPAVRATGYDDLAAALAPRPGLRVVVVATDRTANATLLRSIQDDVSSALASARRTRS